MKSWELLRELFSECCVKNVARKLGLSSWTIYKWTEPRGGTGSGARNPLDVLALLMQLTDARRLAQWVCQQADGYFVPNPPAQPLAPAELLPATGEVMQRLGALQVSVGEAVRDRQVSRAEAAAIRQAWEESKAVTEAYVQQCEGKVFRPQPGPVRQAPPDVRENL